MFLHVNYVPQNKDKAYQILVMLAKQKRRANQALRSWRRSLGHAGSYSGESLHNLQSLQRQHDYELCMSKLHCHNILERARRIYLGHDD